MRKIVLYILIIIGICFLIPIFFTTKFNIIDVFSKEEEKKIADIEKYSYTDFETIRLLHSKTGEIEEKRTWWIYCRGCISRNSSRLWNRGDKGTSSCSKKLYDI